MGRRFSHGLTDDFRRGVFLPVRAAPAGLGPPAQLGKFSRRLFRCGLQPGSALLTFPPGPVSTMKKPTTKNISAAKLEKLLARFEPEHAERLRQLFALWANPKSSKSLPKWQVAELVKAGLVRDETGTCTEAETVPGDAPKFVSGSELARILTRTFNSAVSPTMVSRAIRRDAMPGRGTNGRWETAVAVAWWRAHKAANGERALSLMAQADEADCQRRIAEAQRAAEEFAHWQKETSGMYTLTSEALAGALGAVQKLRGFFRTAADRKFGLGVVTILRERGFTDEQLATVGEVCSAVGRDIVREVEGEAARFSEAQTPVQ